MPALRETLVGIIGVAIASTVVVRPPSSRIIEAQSQAFSSMLRSYRLDDTGQTRNPISETSNSQHYSTSWTGYSGETPDDIPPTWWERWFGKVPETPQNSVESPFPRNLKNEDYVWLDIQTQIANSLDENEMLDLILQAEACYVDDDSGNGVEPVVRIPTRLQRVAAMVGIAASPRRRELLRNERDRRRIPERAE